MDTKFNRVIVNKLLENIQVFGERNSFFIEEKPYSYAELGTCISKIRHMIREKMSGCDAAFVVTNDDIETYSSILALWLEGKYYVPINPKQPIERSLDVKEQMSIDIFLDSSSDSIFSDFRVINTSLPFNSKAILEPAPSFSDDSLAYILFTSGSTGKPKGVMLSRDNLASFIEAFWETGIPLSKEDRCMQCFDLTFDVSIQSFLAPLLKGACVYTIPSGGIKYFAAASLIEDKHITFCSMAPSMLRYLKPYYDELDLSSLKTCILTAEGSPLLLVEEWMQHAVNAEIYDYYGPTEATIYCTYYKIRRDAPNKSLHGIVSIGKPLPGVKVIITNEKGEPVKQGEKGNLFLSGNQISKGYWNNAEKTELSFCDGYYHTGDLCYIDEDGDIMYSGRIDNQTKIQGFRVELGEIEYHARTFLKDCNAVAIAFDNEIGLTEIALFVDSKPFETKELYAFLSSKMPKYMIPSKILFVSPFPLNSNDKTDKVKLKETIK